MATLASPQKITFAEMRDSGARGLLVYCADYRCSHSIAVSADRWPDEVQLSDVEPRFTCTSRGNLRRTGCTVPPFTSIAEHWRYFCVEVERRILGLHKVRIGILKIGQTFGVGTSLVRRVVLERPRPFEASAEQ